MKLAGRLVNGPAAKEAMFLKALEPRAEPEPGIFGLGTELLHQMSWHVTMLEADLEQRRMIDDKGPEYPNACLGEVRGRVIAAGKFVHRTGEQIEGPSAERDDEAFFRPKDRVHGSGARAGLIGKAPDRQPGHSVILDDLLRCVEKSFACRRIVFSRSSHLDRVSQQS